MTLRKRRYVKRLTARAMTRPTMTSEIVACTSIVNFAHADNGMTLIAKTSNSRRLPAQRAI